MKKLLRAAIVYGVAAALTFTFNQVYALFAHGVASLWMSNMYAAPLVLGTFLFLMLAAVMPRVAEAPGYRLFFNVHASGVAVLTDAMGMQGVLDIAGGTSAIVPFFFYIGYGLLALSAVLLVRTLWQARRIRTA